MRWRSVLAVLKWPLALAALGGLFVLGYWIHESARDRRAQQAAETTEPEKRSANRVVKLGAKLADALGIEVAAAESITWTKRVAAYGRLLPHPGSGAEVRAAFAGVLRAPPGGGWPKLGECVKAGQVLGWLDIRVGPQERLDLLARLSEARVKQRGAEDVVQVHQERLDRLKGAGAGVSRSELDTAQTQLTEARTQLETATATVKSWQQALDAIDGQGDKKEKTWSQPLTAPAGGEITEVTARPGTVVEPGSVLVRSMDFRVALVRLELPPEALTNGPPSTVEVFTAPPRPAALAGPTNRPDPPGHAHQFSARLLGPAAQVEVASQFAAYLYEVDTAGTGTSVWRPGLFVKSYVPLTREKSVEAVAVPATSLLYHDGRALVYVELSPGRFERREVRVLGRQKDHWVLADGVEEGEKVISQRAQVLLSEEFRGKADDD